MITLSFQDLWNCFYKCQYKKKIITKPIKGTSKNSKADLNNLKTDIKEKAENLMIVDLMRIKFWRFLYDLSTVCKPGSVDS